MDAVVKSIILELQVESYTTCKNFQRAAVRKITNKLKKKKIMTRKKLSAARRKKIETQAAGK